MTEPVQITEIAAKEIDKLLKKKGVPPDYGLRMSVAGGRGCAQVNYALGFDKKNEDDRTYHIQGLKVFIRKAELMYLVGKRVDYYSGSDSQGFFFSDIETVTS